MYATDFDIFDLLVYNIKPYNYGLEKKSMDKLKQSCENCEFSWNLSTIQPRLTLKLCLRHLPITLIFTINSIIILDFNSEDQIFQENDPN